MRFATLALALSPLLANAFNVVVSNDDGWAEQNVRTFVKALTTAGFSAVLSSPADNQSGTSSADSPPKQVGSGGCQFGSCPAGSPATGFNASNTRLNVRLLGARFLIIGEDSPTLSTVRQLVPRDINALRHRDTVTEIFWRRA